MDPLNCAALPQVYQISDDSLLRKSACNYLRSAISLSGSVALIVADGIRFYTYSDSTGNIMDTFCTIRLPPGDLIRDVAWAPSGWEGEADTLAICFENRLELWTKVSKQKSFALCGTYEFGKQIGGILHIIWDASYFNEVFICSSLQIHKVMLVSSSSSNTDDEKMAQLELLPKLNTRHPGGLALSSDNFITGNAYREAVCALGFVNSDRDVGISPPDNAKNQRRRLVTERCRAPPFLTAQEVQQYEQIRYRPCCTITSPRCGSLCFLAFEPEACISTPVASSLRAPVLDQGGEVKICSLSTGSTSFSSSPLISVVSSSIAMVDEGDSDDGSASDVGLAHAKSKTTETGVKPQGAFPHSTFSTSIAETLSVRTTHNSDGEGGFGFASRGSSALEALQSLSTSMPLNTDADQPSPIKCTVDTMKGVGEANTPINLMATGLVCAMRAGNSHHHDFPSKTNPPTKDLAWLGSTLSLSPSGDQLHGESAGTAAVVGTTAAGGILRPDILAMHPLSGVMSAGELTTSSLLAVSSTLSHQIIVYHVHIVEEENKAEFREVHHFSFPEEGRCRGLCFWPMRNGVVLAALAAKPKAHSMASQSTSATYSTSIVTHKIHKESFCSHKEISKTVLLSKDSVHEDNAVASSLNTSANTNTNDNTIIEMLSHIKTSLEDRLDGLEHIMTQQGHKIDHLQACVEKLHIQSQLNAGKHPTDYRQDI